jgi:hypothetical protein
MARYQNGSEGNRMKGVKWMHLAQDNERNEPWGFIRGREFLD